LLTGIDKFEHLNQCLIYKLNEFVYYGAVRAVENSQALLWFRTYWITRPPPGEKSSTSLNGGWGGVLVGEEGVKDKEDISKRNKKKEVK
jgi:hypothetical protein